MRATLVGLKMKSTLESNNNQDNTPTCPRPSRPPLRPPLQARDHNAMLRNPPLTAKSGNAANNMPSYNNKNPPLMPSLSASATKTANRTPLTPRVAGSGVQIAATPLARRAARPDHNSTPPVGLKDDLSTPVSAFLNNNITPRSGSRKSRVDSTHTTPTSTPTGTPAPPSTHEFPRLAGDGHGSGVGIGLDNDMPKRTTASFTPAVPDLELVKSPGPSTADSKFFFASEAKSAPVRPQLAPKAPSTFFYANGDAIPPPPQSSSTSAVGSAVGEERSQPKFFHANGTPDLQLSPSPHFVPPRPSSTISNTSRMTSPRIANGSPGTLSPPQRPVSPHKLNQPASVSQQLRNAPLLPSPMSRPQPQGRGYSTNNIVTARKASLENGQRAVSHSRSTSAELAELKGASRRISSGSSFDALTISPPTPLNLITTTLPISTPEELPSEGGPSTEDIPPELQSPIKAGNSIEHMNELAAKARRERKVLDLEITNSSLEAINRTLEREMRKQTAELRRYRRLSRSGRLSIATSASMRSASGNLSIMEGVEGTRLSDMSEEDEDDHGDEDSEFDSSETDSLDDGSLSPGAMAESDLRHRKKDEKRLQLDLFKHQQLLIDSQKLNQSLKRCLGWTEELITEGRKALEYHVQVSDVKLGGRILAFDEVEGEGGGAEVDETEGLGAIGMKMLREARIAAANGNGNSWAAGEAPGDRDSGIEIDGGRQRDTFEGVVERFQGVSEIISEPSPPP